MNIYASYARFCASYSSEVIIFFLTAYVGSITLNLNTSFRICHWSFNNCTTNFQSSQAHSNAILLTILRCSTLIYFFLKMKSICKLGSHHIVFSVLFCVLTATAIFSAVVINLLGKDWSIVSGALPIFLMLIDLSRIVALVKHTLSSVSTYDAQEKIAEAMKVLGPVYTVDTTLEILVIFTSGCVNIQQLNELSCFAILSLCINFMIFTTFVPACLATYLRAAKGKLFSHNSNSLPIWHKNEFFHCLEAKKASEKVTFKLKITICVGLVFFNLLRKLLFPKFVIDDVQSSFDSVFTLGPQQLFTLIILMLLGMKLIVKIEKMKSEETLNSSKSSEPIGIPDFIRQTVSRSNSLNWQDAPNRDEQTCMEILKTSSSNLLSDKEIINLVDGGYILRHKLEAVLKDPNRGVDIRRKLMVRSMTENQKHAMHQIPHNSYNFGKATKACCENTIGYIPIPVGVCGPLHMNNRDYHVPLATTEGTLLASTNRGMKAIYLSGGVRTSLYRDGMTRSPVVKFPSTQKCCEALKWIEDPYNFEVLKDVFDGTSRFAKLQTITCSLSGRLLFIRFKAFTGDAMGMNMVSKGAEAALKVLQNEFSAMQIVSLSGNFCTDKKPSAVNWIMGRGKSVVAEAIIKEEVVKKVLKTNIDDLVQTSYYKNQIGSAMSGSIGGFNAHAANIVTALFIATGQDPAQNVESSNCITMLEKLSETDENGVSSQSLLVTCTMPSIEVATVGGGTILDAQNAALKLLNLERESTDLPGEKSSVLAEVVCASVLAGEISLLSALSAGHLVASHMQHNRISHSSNITESNAHNIL